MEKHLPGQETSKTQIQKWMCQLLCRTSISGVKLPHLLFSLVKLCIILIFSNLWKVKWSKCKWFMAWGLFVSFNKSVSLFVSEKGRAVWNSWYVFKVSFKEYFFFFSLLSCFSEETSLPNCSRKLFWDRDIHLCVRSVLVKQSTKPFFHLIHINYLSAAPL